MTKKIKTIGNSVGKGCANKPNDVRAVQCLLNLATNRTLCGTSAPKLTINGKYDDATKAAIKLFQEKAQGVAKPDERIDKNGGCITLLNAALPSMPTTSYTTPGWLAMAYAEEQNAPREKPGIDDNHERILKYLETASHLASTPHKIAKVDEAGKKVLNAHGKPVLVPSGKMMGEVDETPWCACFITWCLQQDGKRGAGASAEQYSRWGTQASIDHIGSICVIKRDKFADSPGTGYHVGFFIGGSKEEGYVALLGGNQDNTVSRKWFVGIEPERIWQRWPVGG